MSARIGIFFFEIGIKKVLFFVCSELYTPCFCIRVHVKLYTLYNHRVVRPMKGLGYHNEHIDAHHATKHLVMLFSGSRNGKYKCQGVDLPITIDSLQWRHNEHSSISNHWHLHCLLNCCFRCRSKKTSKLYVTGLCVGNSPVTGEFPTQRASNAENVSIWWCHHV